MSSISGLGRSVANNVSDNESSLSENSSASTLLIATSSSSTTTTITDSINLSPAYLQTIENAVGNAPDPSDADSLFSALNAEILADPNLGAVGSTIDTYTKSLPGSTSGGSSYTVAPAAYLNDLAKLKTAAASGDLATAHSDLAKAKSDAPENVADGLADAVSVGDTAGQASLTVEGVANFSKYLVTQGYSATGADAEAIALTINGLAEYATDTSNSTAQTRLQQISFLATYAAQHGGTSGASNASDPLFNIISTLQNSQSGSAIDQTLTNLVALYSGDDSSVQQGSTTTTTTTVQTTTLIEFLNKDQENTPSSSTSSTASPSTSNETALQQLKELAGKVEENEATSENSKASSPLFNISAALQDLQSDGGIEQILTNLDGGTDVGATAILESRTSITQTTVVEYLNGSQALSQALLSSGLNVNA